MPEKSQLEETRQLDNSVEQMEAQLAFLNQKALAENSEPPRYSKHYEAILTTISKLAKEYRKQNDFDKEMRLYQAQQNLFSQHWGERESVPWEMNMGICCVHYKKNEDALKVLDSAFQKSQSIVNHHVWVSLTQNPFFVLILGIRSPSIWNTSS
jgi:tetratricopeptide (TPR) repeat protein